MADRRPKEVTSNLHHDAKRRGSLSSPSGSMKSGRPTQHPPQPTTSPRDSFSIPAVPAQSRTQAPPQKIAIPRLRRDSDAASSAGPSKGGDKHRVSHACEPCRHRKTKCSGERPTCKHCEDFKITCLYADGKRDRHRKEFGSMAGRLEGYEKLLRQLSLRVEAPDQIMIQKALEQESTPEEDGMFSAPDSLKGFNKDDDLTELDGEAQVSAEVGSLGSLDRIKEDFNRNDTAKATGYVGKNSEIAWIHRLREDTAVAAQRNREGRRPFNSMAQGSQYSYSNSTGDEGLSDANYHCDDMSVLIPDQVEPFELPPAQTIEILLQTYLDTVHPAFPIIGKLTFSSQVKTFLDNDQLKPGDNWFAILNLIFAIAAKYSHLVKAEWRGDERDHLIYFTRARMLGMTDDTILGHPDLQRVQVAGLMSFYLLSINQISRSWTISGIAIRFAMSLGLNLKNENSGIRDTHKEIRYRVWWALYGLERQLGIMTGRPTSVENRDCTVPLPVPIEEESFNDPSSGMQHGETVRMMRRISSGDSAGTESSFASSQSTRIKQSPKSVTPPTLQRVGFDFYKNIPPSLALYFLCHTRICVLTNNVLVSLYRAGAIKQSWASIQGQIALFDSKLEQWRSSLPPVFDFTKKQRDQQFVRERLSLGFFYYGTRILINRPCLCRLDRRIPNESTRCRAFNRKAAATCVRAATGMLGLMPAEPNPVGLYKVSPWWCLLHHLVQASAILMLELSFRADHMPNEVEEILESAKKAVYWLHEMSEEGVAAHRAWTICDNLLRRVAPKVGRDADDLPRSTQPKRQTSSSSDYSHSGNMVWTPDGEEVWQGPQAFVQQFPGQLYYGGPQEEDRTTIHPPMHTFYDEYLVHTSRPLANTSATDPNISSFFPTSIQMRSMALEDGRTGMHNIFFEPGEPWDPSQISQ